MAERVIARGLLGAMLLASHAALAQALSDPMRPPAAAVSGAADVAAPRPSRLESVLIAPGRQVAVIDGRAVSVGERVGDATLVAIGATEVILQRGRERQVLKLHPGIEKTP